MQFNVAVGHTIRRLRQDKNLTLRDISSKSFIALGHLSAIETASRHPSLTTVEQICLYGLEIEMPDFMKEVYKTYQDS